MKVCEGEYIDRRGKTKKCRRDAVTMRRHWRFGKGDVALCYACAMIEDECRRDAEAEGRVS